MSEMTASIVAGAAFAALVAVLGFLWWLLVERPVRAADREPAPRPEHDGPYMGRHVRHRARWWQALILGVWSGLIVHHVKRSRW